MSVSHYWNEKYEARLRQDWELYRFEHDEKTVWGKVLDPVVTHSEEKARAVAKALREQGHLATVVCGYMKNRQRIPLHSVLFRKRRKMK
jgi:hypothetical protein